MVVKYRRCCSQRTTSEICSDKMITCTSSCIYTARCVNIRAKHVMLQVPQSNAKSTYLLFNNSKTVKWQRWIKVHSDAVQFCWMHCRGRLVLQPAPTWTTGPLSSAGVPLTTKNFTTNDLQNPQRSRGRNNYEKKSTSQVIFSFICPHGGMRFW